MAIDDVQQRAMRGMMWAGVGSLLQQSLQLALGICLARLLSPGDYGLVGVLAVFGAIAGSLQESGFTAALANRKEVRHEDYNAVFWCSLAISVACYAVLFLCAPLIARLYGEPELLWLSRYLFLGFVVASTGIAHSAWLFRHLMVKQRTLAQVPALIASGVVSVTMAWRGYGCWALATQTIIYVGVCSAWYWWMSGWHPTLTFNMRPVREMFGFSSRLLLTNLFSQLQDNVTSSVMGITFRRHDVGQYTQSAKWSTMGCGLVISIVNSVAQPALSTARERAGSDAQLELLRAMLRATAWLAFPAMAGLALVARPFIAVAIGVQWLPCVPLLQVLCVWAALKPVSHLFSQVAVSRGRSSLYLCITVAMAAVQIAMLLLVRSHGVMAMTVGFVAVGAAFALLWLLVARHLAGLRIRMAMSDAGGPLVASIASMGAAWYLTGAVEGSWPLLLSRMGIGGALYLMLTCRQLLKWKGKIG